VVTVDAIRLQPSHAPTLPSPAVHQSWVPSSTPLPRCRLRDRMATRLERR
jgi:hypothetical protein